jgi:glutathione peroxidase
MPKEIDMSATIYDIPVKTIEGADASLRPYAGKVLLIVNVASKCGLTPQYEALEKLYEAQRDRGLVVLGFPANDFGAQEPGTSEEIAEFCSTKFNVQFPLFEKITVKGDARHPLYSELIAAQPEAAGNGDEFRQKLAGYGVKPDSPSGILWNFEKFLIGRDGRVVARFLPDVPPDDPKVLAAIEAELAKPA